MCHLQIKKYFLVQFLTILIKTQVVIPDFISNCGMARVFCYLMQQDHVDMSDQAIFKDTSNIIKGAIQMRIIQTILKQGLLKLLLK